DVVTSFTYYRNALLKTETDMFGQSSGYTYDAFARERTRTNKLQKATSTVYNTRARTTTVRTPEGRSKTILTNAFDETISVTDDNNATNAYEYDPTGDVKAEVDPLKRRKEQGYGIAGWHETHTAPNKTLTKYSHNTAGQ